MKTHYLKCIEPYFTEVIEGRKPFEFRFNDRNYQVGDELILQKYNPELKVYLGREVFAKVTYILKDFEGIKEGYCILGLMITGFITSEGHTIKIS